MRRLPLFLLLLLAIPVTSAANDPIVIGERLQIRSAILGETRTVLVSLPARYASSNERYPVLYLTDGDAHLTHTRGTVDFLAGNGLMPNLIIVGVTNTDRTRDLTPTRVFITRPDGRVQGSATSGGAPRFLEFFEKELFPAIEKQYRTQPFRIFAGHSYGGLLALHIFAARPNLFQSVIAASPSLNWDNDYPLRKVDEALASPATLPRTLFVSMADEEAGDPKPTLFDKLRTLLERSARPGLAWEAKHMPDEDHGSVVLRSHYWGLRRIFDGWRYPVGRGCESCSVQTLEAHFARLTSRMGYPVLPPEATVNQVGYQLLALGRSDDALAVFRENVRRYPESANVYDSLGEALERGGQRDDALANYTKAVERAKASGDPRLETFERNRDRLTAAKKK